jgi:uncharacterized membrane protein
MGTPATRRRGLLFWILALTLWGAAAASAGRLPYLFAEVGARLPADFGRDFVAASVQLANGRVYDPAPDLARQQHALLGLTEGGIAGPFYAHTPAAALVVMPLVPLGFPIAALVWLVLSLGVAGVLAMVLADVLVESRDGRAGVTAIAFVLVLLWPPVLYNIEKGQWSLMLAALMALSWRALAAGRPGQAGAWIGLASMFKLAPAAVFPYFLRRRPRAAAALVVTVGVLAIGSVAVVGVEPWWAFLRQARPNITFWEDRLENVVSVTSLTTRLFAPGRHATPLFDVPMTAQLLAGLITIGLVGAALVLTWRMPARPPPALEGALFALWSILGVLLNPLGWLHTSILLLLPAALVLRTATDPVVPLGNGIRVGSRVAVVLAVALLSLPKETLQDLAGSPPVSPGRVLAVLALPCYAALLLFGTAAFVVHRGAPEGSATNRT